MAIQQMRPEPVEVQEGADIRRREVSPRLIAPLAFAGFVGVLNVIAPAPFLDELAGDLDSSVPLVGQAVSIALLMAALAGLVAGPLADHAGHRRVLLVGLAFAGISALGTALAPGYPTFMATRALAGFGSSLTIGVAFGAAAALFAGPARRRALSIVGAVISLGTALGPLALTTISAGFGWRGAFVAIAALAPLGIIALLALFPAEAPHGNGRFALTRLLDSYRPILAECALLRLYGVWSLRAVCWMGCISFLGSFFTEQHDYSTRASGLVFLVAGTGYMTGTLTAGGRLGAFDLRRLSIGTLLGMAGGWAALFALPLDALPALVLLAATAFLSGIAQTALLTLIADRTTAGPSTSMMLTEIVLSVGAALGGGFGGLLLGAGGYGVMGLGLALAALLSAILVSRDSGTPPPVAVASRPVHTA